MAGIIWIDAAPVDGTTILTSARWEQLKTDITNQVGVNGGASGNIDGYNLAADVVARSHLALGNKDCRMILHVDIDTQGAGATTVYRGPTLPFGYTILSVHYQAATVTGTVDFTFQDDGANVAVTTVAMAAGSPSVGEVTGLSTAVAANSTTGVEVVTGGGEAVTASASADIVISATLV